MSYSGIPNVEGFSELESTRRLRESVEGGPGSGPRKGSGKKEDWKGQSKGISSKKEPTADQEGARIRANVKTMTPLVKAAGFKRDPDNDGDYDEAYTHKDGTTMALEGGGWTHVNDEGDILGEGDDFRSLKDYIKKASKGHGR